MAQDRADILEDLQLEKTFRTDRENGIRTAAEHAGAGAFFSALAENDR